MQIQSGKTLTLTAPYDVLAGAGMLVGGIFGVAENGALSGVAVAANMLGVFDLTKDTSVFTAGDDVYWDSTAKKVTAVSAGNTQIGRAAADALTGASTGLVFVFPTRSFPADTIQTAFVPLTAAQIIAMGTTPITVVAAPGTGKAIAVDQIVVELTTTATQFTGGGVVHFYYHGQTTEIMSGSIAAASVQAGAGTAIFTLAPVATATGSVVTKEVGIDITNATAAFAAGTGTAKLFIRYRIITL